MLVSIVLMMQSSLPRIDRSGRKLRNICGPVVLGIVLFSLVASLATRTFHLQVVNGAQVKASSTSAAQQHLDKDGFEWTPPAPSLVSSEDPIHLETIVLAASLLPAQTLDDVLYNRPPPLS
jgi:hypothetical protein